MRMSKSLMVLVTGLIVCIIVIWLSGEIQGDEKTYEVHPYLTIPEYRTDAARAIDAYERLMERYMDLTERNLFGISTEMKEVVKRLDSIDGNLKELSARMVKIEKAMGIEQDKQPAKKNPESPAFDKKAHEKSSSPDMDVRK